jgi:hypothetical protein
MVNCEHQKLLLLLLLLPLPPPLLLLLHLQEAAAGNILYDVRYKLLNIGLLSAGIGHLLVLQVRMSSASRALVSSVILRLPVSFGWANQPSQLVNHSVEAGIVRGQMWCFVWLFPACDECCRSIS